MEMQHYLITGGAGFIGSNLIRHLFGTESGIRITSIDNFDPFYSTEIKEFNIRDFKNNPNFNLLRNDLGDTSAAELSDLVNARVDKIIHIAAKAGVRPSILNPLAYQHSNVIGLQNLLEFAKMKGVKQFVFASSSSVYGINDHLPWKEDEQLMPISPYAMTKLSGEMLGHVYSRLHGIRFIALRFFTVYGPGQRPDLAIHKFTKAILQDKPITMYGNGETSRDYTYVDDIVQGILAAMSYDDAEFEIINLGNNYSIPLKKLVHDLEDIIGKKSIIANFPDQAGDVPKTFADISKAKKLLDYNPATPLKDGLRNFYEWYLANQELLMRS